MDEERKLLSDFIRELQEIQDRFPGENIEVEFGVDPDHWGDNRQSTPVGSISVEEPDVSTGRPRAIVMHWYS